MNHTHDQSDAISKRGAVWLHTVKGPAGVFLSLKGKSCRVRSLKIDPTLVYNHRQTLAMVTGVETAGLVLAAIPLMIEGLRCYIHGCETIKRYWKLRELLESYLTKLMGFQYVLHDTITELFLQADLLDMGALEEFLKSPTDEPWKRPENEVQLRLHLGVKYETYTKTIEGIKRLMSEISERLRLPKGLPENVRP